MPFEIYRTTAEDIVGATDAILQMRSGGDEHLVANFLDIPVENARNALFMAEQLGLIQQDNPGNYVSVFPYAVYLVTSSILQKAAVLRLTLEQYAPYKAFKFRLSVTDNTQDAANQVRALFTVGAHRHDIASTFVSLGTYTGSLIAEGAGKYRASTDETPAYLSIVNEVVQERGSAEFCVRSKIGDAADWVDQQEVFAPLVTSYQLAALAENDSRSPVVYAGNAVESFFAQVADHFGVNVSRAFGINAKVDALAQAGHLTTKHKFMAKYLGHIRNAADHGIDSEIGQTWSVSEKTAVEYVHVAQSVIVAVVAYIRNQFLV
jgi:hypothetical protein